jgi:hypothetical protein
MKRSWKLWFGQALLLICLGASCLFLMIRPAAAVRAFDRINMGMTLREVEEAIGMPPGRYCSYEPLPLSMSPVGNYLRETGLPAASLSDAGTIDKLTVKRWIWDDHWIWAAFDENGKVVGYYLLEAIGGRRWPKRTFFERVRDFVGL